MARISTQQWAAMKQASKQAKGTAGVNTQSGTRARMSVNSIKEFAESGSKVRRDVYEKLPASYFVDTAPAWLGSFAQYAQGDHIPEGSFVGDYKRTASGALIYNVDNKLWAKFKERWIDDVSKGLIVPDQHGYYHMDLSLLCGSVESYLLAIKSGDIEIAIDCALTYGDPRQSFGTKLTLIATSILDGALHRVWCSAYDVCVVLGKIAKAHDRISELDATNKVLRTADSAQKLEKARERATSLIIQANALQSQFVANWVALHGESFAEAATIVTSPEHALALLESGEGKEAQKRASANKANRAAEIAATNGVAA